MDAKRMLGVGVALSLLGLLLSLANGLLDDDALESVLRPVGGLATLFGLLALVLAVYALAAPAAMPPLVLAGAALFVLGRLASTLLGATLSGPSFGDPGIQLTFAVLTVVSNLGTILLFVGVFQVVRDRVGMAPRTPPQAPRPAPAAPGASPAGLPRPGAIRPPRAPLPGQGPPPGKAPGTGPAREP